MTPTSTKPSGFLLDTHVVLWALYEPVRLSKAARTVLLDPDAKLFMSEASLWELLDKAAKGRLPLAGTSAPVIIERIEGLGVTFLPVTRQDIETSVSLPHHHGDPFDRMLLAQAGRAGLTLLSRDETMPLYGGSVLW